MAGPRAIYVRNGDEELWEQAQGLGEEKFGGLAGFVAAAIREKVTRTAHNAPADNEIIVTIGDPAEGVSFRKQRFRGRWLVEIQDLDAQGMVSGGVALTSKGNYAMFTE